MTPNRLDAPAPRLEEPHYRFSGLPTRNMPGSPPRRPCRLKRSSFGADLLRPFPMICASSAPISGNASNLLSNEAGSAEETRMQIYGDIYDDSMWLIKLVENLLSVTRIEDGNEWIFGCCRRTYEVIAEAMRHTDRNRDGRKIEVSSDEEFILGKMDARLIVQVVINLVDNAVKYTPEGAQIRIHTGKKDGMVVVSVSDTGPGIPDEQKSKRFEKVYRNKPVVDGRRSLGLGLEWRDTHYPGDGE